MPSVLGFSLSDLGRDGGGDRLDDGGGGVGVLGLGGLDLRLGGGGGGAGLLDLGLELYPRSLLLGQVGAQRFHLGDQAGDLTARGGMDRLLVRSLLVMDDCGLGLRSAHDGDHRAERGAPQQPAPAPRIRCAAVYTAPAQDPRP